MISLIENWIGFDRNNFIVDETYVSNNLLFLGMWKHFALPSNTQQENTNISSSMSMSFCLFLSLLFVKLEDIIKD